jgi:hypothetical protein
LIELLQTAVLLRGAVAGPQAAQNRFGGGKGGDKGHPVLDGGPADGIFIRTGLLPQRGIDDQVDVTVFNFIDDIRSPFSDF